MQRFIVNLAPLPHTMPVDGIGDGRGRAWPVAQGVQDAPKIADVLTRHTQAGRAFAQIHPHSAARYLDGPEYAIGKGEDPRVEVVNLGREVGEVKLTSIDIQSDKAERIMVDSAIHPDIGALHEAHVDIEEQAVRAGSLELCSADESVEIGDGGGLLPARIEHMEGRIGEERLWDRPGRHKRAPGAHHIWRE